MIRPVALALVIVTACSPQPRSHGPLGSAAIAELGESARCEHPDGMSFITCQAKHGDTVVSSILDTDRTVRSLTRSWRGPHGPQAFLRARDSLSRLLGPGIPCETDADLSFEAGRAWAGAPVVTELRLGGNLGPGQIELTRRVARSPQCTGSTGAPPA
jgi:hypothetical protein